MSTVDPGLLTAVTLANTKFTLQYLDSRKQLLQSERGVQDARQLAISVIDELKATFDTQLCKSLNLIKHEQFPVGTVLNWRRYSPAEHNLYVRVPDMGLTWLIELHIPYTNGVRSGQSTITLAVNELPGDPMGDAKRVRHYRVDTVRSEEQSGVAVLTFMFDKDAVAVDDVAADIFAMMCARIVARKEQQINQQMGMV